MLKPDRQPFKPESSPKFGPAVDFWYVPEENRDKVTDHEALMRDTERRSRVGKRLRENIANRKAGAGS